MREVKKKRREERGGESKVKSISDQKIDALERL